MRKILQLFLVALSAGQVAVGYQLPAQAEFTNTWLPVPYTYSEFLRQGNCLGSNGQIKSLPKCREYSYTRSYYNKFIDALRSKGCLSNQLQVMHNIVCMNVDVGR